MAAHIPRGACVSRHRVVAIGRHMGVVGHIHEFSSNAARMEILRLQRIAYTSPVRLVCSCPLRELCHAKIIVRYMRQRWDMLQSGRD